MTAWARVLLARPKLVLAVIIAGMAVFGLFGASASKNLSAGGFTDPASESALVDQLVTKHFGPQNPDVIALYTAPPGKTVDDIGPQVRERLDRIDPALLAKPIESYWSSFGPRKNLLRSADGRQAVAVVFSAGDESARLAAYPDIEAALRVPGVDSRMSGFSAVSTEITGQSQRDLIVAESISLPITLLILVVVFGGVVAASLPVAVGLLAVAGSMGAIRVLTEFTEVSTFAVNIASLLGLGMAIDYGLFLVNRFREEIAEGRDVPAAIQRTCATAGRTIAFSALLLICAFAGMFVFPQAVLRSLGFGAMIAVALAAALSLTVLPALLALFGHRIGRPKPAKVARQQRTERFWGRVVDAVLRRPGAIALAVGALLLVLAAPVTGIRLGEIDHRALPADNAMRQTVDELAANFPGASSGATAVLQGVRGAVPQSAQVESAIRALDAVPGVRSVAQVGRAGDFVVLHAFLEAGDRSPAAQDTVRAMRDAPAPGGTEIRVGGDTGAALDGVTAIKSRLPLMLAAMVVATVLLLLVAFRSIVLPLKAVAMAALSLAATFGVLTWIFNDGHLAGALGVHVGPIDTGMLVLIIAVVFGLSTDYEVFLLSRMSEAHQAGANTAESVRIGTVKTARVITAAAVLLVFVTGAFTLSPLTPMRFLGIGMIIALIVDATLVRMLLVPALVQLMGPANWWLPGRRGRRAVTVVESADDPDRAPAGV
ncbi:MMPL family transporter [Nocardia sp. NPDC048505]|uniref:MMPL family transporter n=1 Tax=unclassified Nocardia TaxID=2637762 RepID=UPI0033DC97E0